jgi:chemotaxis protein methyltransferase CheR
MRSPPPSPPARSDKRKKGVARFNSYRDEIPLKPEEFRLLRDLFSQKIGVQFGQESRFAMERRLRERIALLKLSTFAEYYQYLRFHPLAPAEWEEAIELLTTNETYFFREDYQLRAFKNELVPMLAAAARPRRRLNVWSAGCSTGEEVYSIAMILIESPLLAGWDVRIFGSDISKRCVAAARKGIYGAAAFRAMPDELKRRYFTERTDGFHVSERLRGMCHFGQMNLMEEEKARLLGRADAVFCRNVLIYFDTYARRRVIDMFHERLYAGGVLLLGHSESLLNVSTAFELLHLREDLVYKKPLGAVKDPGKDPLRDSGKPSP